MTTIRRVGVVSSLLLAFLMVSITTPLYTQNATTGQPIEIAIVGDVQQTSPIEELLIARENNDAERERVVAEVANDKPNVLLMLGDMVSRGESNEDWNLYDRLMKPITDQKIRTYAVIGNHDYGFYTRSPQFLRNFYQRFDQSKEIPTVADLGRGIVLVMVNSNFDMISPDDYRIQRERYLDLLKRFDEDPAVRGVIVASHHPPYSNSSLGNDQGVIDMFAEPFLHARKTRLYLAGHVHSYERFVTGDKMFVTSGGGGGPRRQCSTSPTRLCKNDAYREGTLRPFHYVRLTVSDDAMKGEVMMLRQRKGKKTKEFVVGDRFNLGVYGTVTAAVEAEKKGPDKVVEKTPETLTK